MKTAGFNSGPRTNFNVLLLQHLRRSLSDDEFKKISAKLNLKLPKRLDWQGNVRSMTIEEAIKRHGT